jgi:hypothetical protein
MTDGEIDGDGDGAHWPAAFKEQSCWSEQSSWVAFSPPPVATRWQRRRLSTG